jgi:hypothetical protein
MTIEAKPFNRKTEKGYSNSGKIHFNNKHRRTRFDTHAVAMMGAKKHMFAHFVEIGAHGM